MPQHFVGAAIDEFTHEDGHGFLALLGSMAQSSHQHPEALEDFIGGMCIPAEKTMSHTIQLGRQRTCVPVPNKRGRAGSRGIPFRVLLVHDILWCCEQLHLGMPLSPLLCPALELLLAVFTHPNHPPAEALQDWTLFMDEVGKTYYWEKYHLDLLGWFLPAATTTADEPYATATAGGGIGVSVVLSAVLMRALPKLEPAVGGGARGAGGSESALAVATACVRMLSLLARSEAGLAALGTPHISQEARPLLQLLVTLDELCVPLVDSMPTFDAAAVQQGRGRFALASLDFTEVLCQHLHCGGVGMQMQVYSSDCLGLVAHFVRAHASTPRHEAAGQAHLLPGYHVHKACRWAIAEACGRVLLQSIHTARLVPTPGSGRVPTDPSLEPRVHVLRCMLAPASEDDTAIHDFLLELLAQSLRLNHILQRQSRPSARSALMLALATTLQLVHEALSTPVTELRELELFPLSGTALVRRLFAMRPSQAGFSNDHNVSLIDEVAELCAMHHKGGGGSSGSPGVATAARAVMLSATKCLATLCRLLGSPQFGNGEVRLRLWLLDHAHPSPLLGAWADALGCFIARVQKPLTTAAREKARKTGANSRVRVGGSGAEARELDAWARPTSW